ncbi:15844_t:CDS:2 [Funneliformis mosseae]|uniref:15844_t:CDS:1 n=1 Tax=Funneliformis mosseae TaxID=27381 RepID=A0A9N8VP52_FUNMO|nr:15844_t:CDS:2 [Funneliformis mosseae]
MGNGQKAQHKRERAKNDAKKGATSQLKANEAAKNIVCQVCRNTFLCTVRKKALDEHAGNKHSKKLEECFPGFVETANKNTRTFFVTSQRAVEGLKVAWEQVLSSGERIDVLEEWKALPYFVVGRSTAKAVKEMFKIDPLGADESGNSESLADYIIKYFNSTRGKELLFLVGDKRREELPNKLSKSGILLKELRIYETKPNSSFSTELDKISEYLVERKKTINWIIFFSPSGVDNSLELLKVNLLKDWDKIKIASIGKTTSKYLENIKNIKVNITSPKPEAESLAESIHEYNKNLLS